MNDVAIGGKKGRASEKVGFFSRLSTRIALFAGAISVFLRDFPLFALLLQQGLFFLTPIIYPLEVIPEA